MLEFSILEVWPHSQLDDDTRSQVQATIERLKLNDKECRDAQALWHDAYISGGLTFATLEQWSPFVAKELRRQGRVI